MPAYPSALPLPRIEFSAALENSVARSSADGGKARQRNRFALRNPQYSFKLTLSQAQCFAFRAFYNDDISQGMDWFDMDLDVTGSVGSHEVRFTSPVSWERTVKGFWEVSAKMEMRAPRPPVLRTYIAGTELELVYSEILPNEIGEIETELAYAPEPVGMELAEVELELIYLEL